MKRGWLWALLISALFAVPLQADFFKKGSGPICFKKGLKFDTGLCPDGSSEGDGSGSGGFAALSHSVQFSDGNLDDEKWARSDGASALDVVDDWSFCIWVEQQSANGGATERLYMGIGDASTTDPFSNGSWTWGDNTVGEQSAVMKSTADGGSNDIGFTAGVALDQFLGTFVNGTWSLVCLIVDGSGDAFRLNADGSDVANSFTTGSLEVMTDGTGRAIFLGGTPIDVLTDTSVDARIAVAGVWSVKLSASACDDLYASGSPSTTADWRESQGSNYTTTEADALEHYYRGTSATYADFATDIVGSADLTVVDSTGPDDSDMVADFPGTL